MKHRKAVQGSVDLIRKSVVCFSLVLLVLTSIVFAPFDGVSRLANAAESNQADLVVNFVNTPVNGAAGEAFSYDVEVKNLGPGDGNGSQVTFNLGDGVTNAAIVCKEVRGGGSLS